MKIDAVGAVLCSARFDDTLSWYETLFERPPDAMPMPGLAEWHMPGALLQIIDEPQRAGNGRVTLLVTDIDVECAGLSLKGIDASEVMDASMARTIELEDPDGNLVTLAQPQQIWSL